jgi:RNAse (barnase) inhibitor barstar
MALAYIQGITKQFNKGFKKMNSNNDSFENDLISQLRVSHYYASNQDDVCDDMAGAIRLLNKISANNTLKHTDSLMLKAIVKVALDLLDDVDTENLADYL